MTISDGPRTLLAKAHTSIKASLDSLTFCLSELEGPKACAAIGCEDCAETMRILELECKRSRGRISSGAIRASLTATRKRRELRAIILERLTLELETFNTINPE